MSMSTNVEKRCSVGGNELILASGGMARQADGACVVRLGDTMVLAAAVGDRHPRPGGDFFPLTVDYREKYSAAGKYPGGFFKREGRPTEKEILTCRLIDRPIRPLFPKAFQNETQVMVQTLSADMENDPDILAMNAAFAALAISDIPFDGVLGAVRIGRVEGELIVNPIQEQLDVSDLNLIIAARREAIVMVEGEAQEVGEEVIVEALNCAQAEIVKIIDAIEALGAEVGRPKREVDPLPDHSELEQAIRKQAFDRMKEACFLTDKLERQNALEQIKADMVEAMTPANEDEADPNLTKIIGNLLHDLEAEILRTSVLQEGVRADGRDLTTVRPISCEVGLLPRTHGSALFTRGQTQALVTATLGTVSDEQVVDNLMEETTKKFMLHYNFPPFCVGETRPIRGPGRREIGHGMLAERSLSKVLPDHEDFPYTIRVNSDILESNGSSSMASVCGGCLALMDAGVPITAPVAGVAMGLVADGDRTAVLTDILGVEDHLGDMDFKIAGTREGITAVQMDIKLTGLDRQVMEKALEQAHEARQHILGEMEKALEEPREAISPLAPRIEVMQIPIDRIRDVIGPGGKVIRGIIAETGAKIDVDDEGKIVIASSDKEGLDMAIRMIEELTAEVEIGRVYHGKVVRIVPFGAFVEVLPGQDGLVHISELATGRVEKTEDVANLGDEMDVKVVEIDDMGRVNLSKVQADIELGRLSEEEQQEYEQSKQRGGDRGGRGGGGRGGDRGGRGGGDRGGRGGGGRGGDRRR